MDDNYTFLGTGWSFPPTFISESASVATTSGIEDINRSLEIILTTQLGERIMQPTFGCSLRNHVFEVLNAGSIGYIQNMIKTAVVYHEARIDVKEVKLDSNSSEEYLLIEIIYQVRQVNSRFNFVFPYYLNEANRLP